VLFPVSLSKNSKCMDEYSVLYESVIFINLLFVPSGVQNLFTFLILCKSLMNYQLCRKTPTVKKDDPTDFPNESIKLQKLAPFPWWLRSFVTHMWYETCTVLRDIFTLSKTCISFFLRWLLIFVNAKGFK
jgi:hypothetical protein